MALLNSSQITLFSQPASKSRRSSGTVRISRASRRDREQSDDKKTARSSRVVDESMIVLRKRIHAMKMVERNYEPPSEWWDWEKKYYTCYDDIICRFVGFLQAQMMSTRPGLALAMAALVFLSVPASSALVFFNLLAVVKGLIVVISLVVTVTS